VLKAPVPGNVSDATTDRPRALGPALLGLVLVVLGTVGYFVAVIELGAWLPDLRNRDVQDSRRQIRGGAGIPPEAPATGAVP